MKRTHFLLSLALWLAPLAAAAQSNASALLVLPASTAEPAETERVLRAADQIVAALASEHTKLTVLPLDPARQRFVAVVSRDPVAVPQSEVDQLPHAVRTALDNYAFGQRPLALRQVQTLIERAEHTSEALMRDTQVARQLLDACLIRVRNSLDHGAAAEADRLAMACRSLALNVAPTKYLHPQPVLDELQKADDALRLQPAGTLHVTSEPTGCTVFVNGRALGTTPYDARLPAGEQRVQVECGSSSPRGRVHVVPMAQSDLSLNVDTALDSALRSASGAPLRIELADTQALARDAPGYASAVAGALGASSVFLVTSKRADSVVIQRLEAAGPGHAAEVSYEPVAGAGHELAAALAAIQAGRNWRLDPALAVDCSTNAQDLLQTQLHDAAMSLALRCIEAGRADPDPQAASRELVALYAEAHAELARPAHPPPTAARPLPPPLAPAAAPRRSHFNTAAMVLTVAGAALLAGSMPTLYVAETRSDKLATLMTAAVGGTTWLPAFAVLTFSHTPDGVPWWSWALGGVGAAGVTWGIYKTTLAGQCASHLRGRCTERYVDADVDGAFWVTASAPFVLLPITHALFNHDGRNAAHLALQPSGTGVSLTGRF